MTGDLFLDRWYEIDTSLNEPSLETGITAYQIVRKRSAAGAAGTVLNNLSAMKAGTLRAVSMLGSDGDGWETLQHLKNNGIDIGGIIISGDISTPSYIKPLFPDEGNRLDIKNFIPTPGYIEDKLIEKAGEALRESDAMILLDQVCEKDTGVLTSRVRRALCDMAKQYPGKLIWADSRAFIGTFTDVTIKCNHREAMAMAGRGNDEERFDRDEVFECMDELKKRTGHPAVVTCGPHGIAVDEDGQRLLVPAVRHTGPIDICGAGDACSAGMVSALCAGASLSEAAFIGNLSSGVTVRKIGMTGTASREEMVELYREQWGDN